MPDKKVPAEPDFVHVGKEQVDQQSINSDRKTA